MKALFVYSLLVLLLSVDSAAARLSSPKSKMLDLYIVDTNHTGNIPQLNTESKSGHNAVTARELIIEPPTLICLGFEWKIEGDDNHNASVSLHYRKKPEKAWREALPLLRIGDEQSGVKQMNYVTKRLFAGSILDLVPDTEYEYRLVMSDPDGVRGKAVHEGSVRTRSEPRVWPGGHVRHVYPLDYKGKREDPAYHGLMQAYYGYPRFLGDWNLYSIDPVQPGDVILVHAGLYRADRTDYRGPLALTFYGTYTLTRKGTAEKPIVIRAAGDGEVVFDGAGAHCLFNVMAADYNWFGGLTIHNTDVAFHAGEKDVLGARGLIVKNCLIEDVGIGVTTEYAGSKNYYIADNVILGRFDRQHLTRTSTDATGRRFQRLDSYYGIKVYGQGHVICYNRVAYFWDGIDIATYGAPESQQDRKPVAIDIYNNDVSVTGDNSIEADGGLHNIRILRNRCFNSATDPFSFQPVLGGPAYLIRNIGYNTPASPAVKWWGMRPAGVLVYHNTVTASPLQPPGPGGNEGAGPAGAASNFHFRNNLFLGSPKQRLPVISLETYTSYSTMDYDGYRMFESKMPFVWHGPAEGILRDYQLKTPVKIFSTLDAFRAGTGQEVHAVVIDYDVFKNVREPDYTPLPDTDGLSYQVYFPEDFDFNLKPGTVAVDMGCRLPNINEDFTGKAPDLGAIELGRPIPHYGPRTPEKPAR